MKERIDITDDCYIEFEHGKECRTYFADGTSWGAYPHDTPHYHVISHRCGYGDNIWSYCIEHEIAHEFLAAEGFFGGISVVYSLAHNHIPVPPKRAAVEEAMVQTFQRWVRANERPIISGIDWDGLKTNFLELGVETC